MIEFDLISYIIGFFSFPALITIWMLLRNLIKPHTFGGN